MKILKYSISIFILVNLLIACGSTSLKSKEKPVVIANDSLQYEVIIIDIGFNNYLNSIAKPKGFYNQNYLENKNRIYINTWNYRARNPSLFDPTIYENAVDYNTTVNYGYDVNYKLFNYFEFAQRKYNMTLR